MVFFNLKYKDGKIIIDKDYQVIVCFSFSKNFTPSLPNSYQKIHKSNKKVTNCCRRTQLMLKIHDESQKNPIQAQK